MSGIADDERCAQRLLVHVSLVKPSVLAHVETLVGGVDDDGVVGESVLVEIVEQVGVAINVRVGVCAYLLKLLGGVRCKSA